MNNTRTLEFTNPTKGVLAIDGVIREIALFIAQEPNAFYRLVIGTDSQAYSDNGNSRVDYVTALVVHRLGRGARYFWRKEKIYKKVVLREKVYNETMISLTVAHEVVPLLRNIVTPVKYDLEIHIDVGPLGPTREMIKEVVGMVNGSGYVAKTKPDSWAASSVADKHT